VRKCLTSPFFWHFANCLTWRNERPGLCVSRRNAIHTLKAHLLLPRPALSRTILPDLDGEIPYPHSELEPF